jgi:hypothetical protein
VLVPLVDMEVVLEEVDDREVGRCLPVGDRAGLDDQPAVGAMGVRHLPDEAGLADTRLPHDGHDLAVSRRLPQGLSELLQLDVATDEPGQSPRRRRVHTRAKRPGSDHLVDFDRRIEPLDRHRSERLDLDVPFGEPQRVRREPDAARRGELLHPPR